MKIKWNGYFQENMFEKLGIPHEVVLFSWKLCKLALFHSALVLVAAITASWTSYTRMTATRIRKWKYFRIFPFICREILAIAKFVKKATDNNMPPWCSCLFCIGWLGNVQRFRTRAQTLYDSFKPFVLRHFRCRCGLYRGVHADVIVYIFAHLHTTLRTEENMLDTNWLQVDKELVKLNTQWKS